MLSALTHMHNARVLHHEMDYVHVQNHEAIAPKKYPPLHTKLFYTLQHNLSQFQQDLKHK